MERLKEFERLIGLEFKDKTFLQQALTHKSYAYENNLKHYNERLEFLGDSVLNLIVSRHLYEGYPLEEEGRLSKLKAQITSRPTLVRLAEKIKLGKYLYLSRGEIATGGRERPSILADTFEALIGAIYLDKGFKVIYSFLMAHLEIKELIKHEDVWDFKTVLQEVIQQKYKQVPEYKITAEYGPDHEKIFEVQVAVKKDILGSGKGENKKKAEQAAAKEALKKLKVEGY
ncbi:MAG: ribonuclease III [bacterium]